MDVKGFLSDVAVSGLRYGADLVRGIITVPIIIGAIGIDGYGTWTGLLAITSILGTVCTLNLSTALTRYVPQSEMDEQVLIDTLAIVIFVAPVVALGYITLALMFPTIAAGSDKLVVLASGGYILSSGLMQLTSNFPRAINRIKVYEMVVISRNTLEAVGILFVFTQFRSLLGGFVILILVPTFLTGILLVYYLPLRPPMPNVANFSKYIRFSLPEIPQTISSRLIRGSDRYLLLLFVGPAAAGTYSVATLIGTMIEDLGKTLNPTLYPRVVQKWEQNQMSQLSQLYDKILKWFTLLSVPAFVGIIIVGVDLMTLISTPDVADSAFQAAVVLTLAYLISGINSPLVFVFHAAERVPLFSRIYIIGAVLNTATNLILIPRFGIMGAAITTLGTYLLITADIYRLTSKMVEYRFSIGILARAGLGATVMGILLFIMPTPENIIARLILQVVVGIIIYLLAVALLGAVSQDEIKWIRSTIRGN